MTRNEFFSKETAIFEANKFGVSTYTEIVCTQCKKSFFEVFDKNDSAQKSQWLFGLWRHGICPLCNYQAIYGDNTSPSFHFNHLKLS